MDSDKSMNIFYLLRLAQGKSVKEIADQLHISVHYVNAIENGSKYPSDRLLYYYAIALETPLDVIKSFNPEDYRDKKFKYVLKALLTQICDE